MLLSLKPTLSTFGAFNACALSLERTASSGSIPVLVFQRVACALAASVCPTQRRCVSSAVNATRRGFFQLRVLPAGHRLVL